MTSKIRGNTDPAWCNDPSNKYADWFPLRNSFRQASFYDPKTKQFTLIDTCFSTHHLQFDNDPDETVYFNELSGPIFGWIDTKVYDQTHDEQKSGRLVRTGAGYQRRRKDHPAVPGPRRWVRAGDASILYSTDTGGGAPTPGGGRAGGAQARSIPSWIPGQLQHVRDSFPSPVDDSVWGVAERFPRLCWSGCSAATILRRAARPSSSRYRRRATIRAAWISTATAWSGRSGRHQPSGQLRRSQVQGPEWPGKSRWQPVQGRLDALSDPRPQAEGHRYSGGFPLLQLGGPAECHRARREHAVRHRVELRLADCAESADQKWTYFRVPYPLGFYSRGMDARIDDARRMERPCALLQLRHALRLAHRRRQRAPRARS
jgi:hypothetical protein